MIKQGRLILNCVQLYINSILTVDYTYSIIVRGHFASRVQFVKKRGNKVRKDDLAESSVLNLTQQFNQRQRVRVVEGSERLFFLSLASKIVHIDLWKQNKNGSNL